MLFKNLESLDPIKHLLAEAAEGLKSPSRTIDTSSMKEVLGAAAGAGVGGVASFVALYTLGTVGLSAVGITSALAAAGALVGGGMVAGIFVLAAPIAVMGVGGYMLVSKRNHRRLVQAKEALLQEILVKRDAVLKNLEERVALSEERAQYLNALNATLTAAIRDLQSDLAAE